MNPQTPARTIYPEPKNAVWEEGSLSIDRQVILNLPEDSAHADFFQKTWKNFTCGKIEIILKSNLGQQENSFFVEVDGTPELPALAEKSTYALTINAQGFAAAAVDGTALKQAWLTMLQMLEPKPGTRQIEGALLPHVKIQDYPLLQFRCAHLCVFPETTLAALEKNINLLAMHKYSHVVIEFWGMLKLDALPELAWPQAYSKSQVKPLLQWVRELGMEPIPMFNHWGHATASRVANGRHVVLDQNPTLTPLFEPDGWTWCLTNPEALNILAGVRKELIELFGNVNYFHLGCDEAYSHATCNNCRKHNPAKLFAEFLNSVNDDLKRQEIRPFIWGDALLER
ncbi:MAG: family 20 glycosylhydrolase, partial [Phycisphaerae bacterium]|nr:family 20 glycosylhydrolase [Phycisphaerae bacterium]